MPTHLLLLLLLLLPAPGVRAGLPAWEALERVDRERLLAVDGHGALWLVSEARLDSVPLRADLLAGGTGGPGPVQVEEVDARLGLQWLALDGGSRLLLQLDRQGRLTGRGELAPAAGLWRPGFLALSAGRSLVAADRREGSVAVRRPGEEWSPLLDYAGAGPLRPRALEVVGERVFLLDERRGGRLWLCGTEGGWRQVTAAEDLAGLHRGESGELLLLYRREGALELEAWPDAAHLASLPDPGRRVVGRYDDPGGVVRDFLPLGGDAGPRRLLLTRKGDAALVLAPRETRP
jgi:hypothetical protein